MDRSVVGPREFDRATAGRGTVAVGKVREASPVLAEGVAEFIFADVFSRPGLTAREREIVTVVALSVLGGAENQLGVHVPAALTCGADPDELIAVCEQIAPYAGFPRALNALRAVRGVLEERGLPLPPAVERVHLGDHETTITRIGAGPPVVLVHPPGLDRSLWRDTARDLAADREVIVPDLRGDGDAGGAPDGDPAADVVRLVELLGLGPVTLAGHGAAAAVALSAARLAPGLVSRLVLSGPVTPAATDVPGALVAWLSPRRLAEDGWPVRHLRDRLERNGLRVATPPGGPSAPVAGDLVVGEADPERQAAAGFAEALGLELVVLPGCAHLLPLEAPGALAGVLRG